MLDQSGPIPFRVPILLVLGRDLVEQAIELDVLGDDLLFAHARYRLVVRHGNLRCLLHRNGVLLLLLLLLPLLLLLLIVEMLRCPLHRNGVSLLLLLLLKLELLLILLLLLKPRLLKRLLVKRLLL